MQRVLKWSCATAVLLVITAAGLAWAEDAAKPAAQPEPTTVKSLQKQLLEENAPAEPKAKSAETAAAPSEAAAGSEADGLSPSVIALLLFIFVLAIFIGFEIITKVPPTLHTPLMSGSNAISGITIVGALLVAGDGQGVSAFIGFLAVVLATINAVGGFLVTHRMLAMFQKR